MTPDDDLLQRIDDVACFPGEPSGAAILNDVAAFLKRFVAYPSDNALIAHTLWIAHTHLMDAWESTPRLAFLSPEPASGKTRALEVTELLVPNPVEAVNVTPAYLFRKVGDENGPPTVLYDEIDTVFGPKARDNEELRGLLNAGHRKGAVAGRCVTRGNTIVTEEIPAYCAVALAGLGNLPDTIMTRSVVIHMRRRASHEHVTPYRRKVYVQEGHDLRQQLAGWAEIVRDNVKEAWPEMPVGIVDRDADVWEPLLAMADAAGGTWPAAARVAAVALVSDSKDNAPSLGIRLLTDLRIVFKDRHQMNTEAILSALGELPESPWRDVLGGQPLTARRLATMLEPYGVKPKPIRIGETTLRGYTREALHDAWTRYLPPQSAQQSDEAKTVSSSSHTSATPATCETWPERLGESVTGVAGDVPSCQTRPSLHHSNVADVADVTHLRGKDDDRGNNVPPGTCLDCQTVLPLGYRYRCPACVAMSS